MIDQWSEGYPISIVLHFKFGEESVEIGSVQSINPSIAIFKEKSWKIYI